MTALFQKELEVKLIKYARLLLLVVLCWLLSVGVASPPEQPKLVYELKPRVKQANFGKPFFADYFVRNKGSEPIVLCNCQLRGGIIFGQLGKNNEAPLFLDRFSSSEPPKAEDFITIPPHSTVKFSWGGFGEKYFSSPGEWVLKIRDSFSAANTPNGERSWQGIIESPLLRVTVAEKGN